MGNRRGRPLKAHEDLLSERVEIRLSREDKQTFERAAEEARLSLSDWIRCTLCTESRRAIERRSGN